MIRATRKPTQRQRELKAGVTDAGVPIDPEIVKQYENRHSRQRKTVRAGSNPVNAGRRQRSQLAAYPCIHRGSVIRHDTSNLCGSKGEQIAVFACAVHGECSLGRYCSGQSVRTCSGCDDREKPAGNLVGVPIDRARLTTHILYHVMPLAGGHAWIWRRHMAWLRGVRHQFNGRLIVGIVTPGQRDHWAYEPPEAVMAELTGLGAEYVTAPNDVRSTSHREPSRAGRGEGVLFPQLLERIRTSDPDEVVFYGHCKGVSRGGPETAAPHKWAAAMFETLFRNRDAAVAALDHAGICGPFRMNGGFPLASAGVGPNWFFSGTFFAFRCADVFKRKWRKLPKHYGCVEQFPRLLFDQFTESSCLFFDGVTNLYDDAYWAREIEPALSEWRSRGT